MGKGFHRIKNKEEKTKNIGLAWVTQSTVFGVDDPQSWLGVWGLADQIYYISVQVGPLKGSESYLSFGLLMRDL